MAAVIRSEFDLEPELIAGSGGIFEVRLDGQLIAAKDRGAFPTEQAIVDALTRALPNE